MNRFEFTQVLLFADSMIDSPCFRFFRCDRHYGTLVAIHFHQDDPSLATLLFVARSAVRSHHERRRCSLMNRAFGFFVSVSNSLRVLITVTSVCCFAVGCGKAERRLKVYPVEGRITLAGKPVPEALVVFHPKDQTNSELLPARAKTDPLGTFKATTYVADDGAVPGDYSVTVTLYPLVKNESGFEPGPNVLPAKLSQASTTDITVTVAAGPNTLAPIEVKR